MFTKGLIIIVFASSIIHAYVVDRGILELENFPELKVNLSFQHPEVRAGLFEGDIAISETDNELSKISWNFEKYPTKKWPNRVIPYRISGLYTEYDVAAINVAIKALNRMSCVKFKPHENEEDYLLIWPVKYPKGCWAFIGKQGGPQIVSLDPSDDFGDNCLSADGMKIKDYKSQ
jgi:hypothetical protein